MRPRSVAALLAIPAAATVVWAAWTWYATWDAIPVVRTCAELRAQAPIVLADGTSVWIGKEAKSAPVGSGVLVYVLAEGGPARASHRRGDQVGPIRIRTHPVDSIRKEAMELRPEPSALRLYLCRVDLTQPGCLPIEALTLDGEILRASQIRGTAEPFATWVPWGSWRSGDPSLVQVAGPALPEFSQTAHVVSDPNLALPSLIPEERTLSIALAEAGEAIVVQAAQEKLKFYRVADFLVRFWVNGRPVVTGQPKAWTGKIGQGFFSRPSILLDLDLPWRAIGARPGDRVELEVLYCALGASPVSESSRRALRERRERENEAADLTRLSNRLTLTAE